MDSINGVTTQRQNARDFSHEMNAAFCSVAADNNTDCYTIFD